MYTIWNLGTYKLTNPYDETEIQISTTQNILFTEVGVIVFIRIRMLRSEGKNQRKTLWTKSEKKGGKEYDQKIDRWRDRHC